MCKREEELQQRIYELEQLCDKKKWKRTVKTFAVLTIVIYYLAFIQLRIVKSIEDALIAIILCPLIALGLMFVSMLVTLYITSGAISDTEAIARLKGNLEEARLNEVLQSDGK